MPFPKATVINLLFDFDQTLTKRRYHFSPRSPRLHPPRPTRQTRTLRVSSLPPWSHFTSTYLSSLPTPASLAPKTLAALLQYLQSPVHAAAERASVERIEAAGLFRGLTRAELVEGGRRAVKSGNEVVVREGWRDCVQLVEKGGGKVGVVSVNWSRAWMRGCLGLGGEGEDDDNEIRIEANELLFDSKGCSTGQLERRWSGEGVWTAVEKGRVMSEVLSEWPRQRTVYIGDSEGDLVCLDLADIGVIMRGEGEKRSLEKTLDGLEDVLVKWAGEWKQHHQQQRDITTGKKMFWWIRGFEDLLDSGILK